MKHPRHTHSRYWVKILEAESSRMSLADYARADDLRAQTLTGLRSTVN